MNILKYNNDMEKFIIKDENINKLKNIYKKLKDNKIIYMIILKYITILHTLQKITQIK